MGFHFRGGKAAHGKLVGYTPDRLVCDQDCSSTLQSFNDLLELTCSTPKAQQDNHFIVENVV